MLAIGRLPSKLSGKKHAHEITQLQTYTPVHKKKKGRSEGAKRGTQRVELRTTEDFSQVWKPNGVSAGGFQI